jgi:hypothetical protein
MVRKRPWIIRETEKSNRTRTCTNSTPSESENKLKLDLSTGYKLELDLTDARPGLEHPARALVGEIMFPKVKRSLTTANKRKKKPDLKPGRHAVKNEILKIIDGLDQENLRLLVIATMWAYLVGEFDRINANDAATN